MRLADEETVRVRVLVRDARRLPENIQQKVEIIEGDLFDKRDLVQATESMDLVYYPIRFLGMDKEFEELSMAFAESFRDACIYNGVKRIVYFGAHDSYDSSNPLVRSMAKTGDILSALPEHIQTVWLRAGIVLGSGSIMFDTLRSLVMKAPVIPVTTWMTTRTFPISIADAVESLARAGSYSVADNAVIELGSEEVSLEDILKVTAEVMGVKIRLFHVPANLDYLSSLSLIMFTPLSFRLASTIIQTFSPANSKSRATIGISRDVLFSQGSSRSLRQVIAEATRDVENDQVFNRWTDSLAELSYTFSEEEVASAVFRDVKVTDFGDLPPSRIFRAVKSVGGTRGWFTFDLLWQIRGLMDKLMGGFGTSVGRRTETDLRIGEMLDVWRVVDLVEDKRLLLEAQMTVFGKAWLEFRIDGRTLTQSAYHLPDGILGRLYWYSMLPFHSFIFKDMIQSIVKRARMLE